MTIWFSASKQALGKKATNTRIFIIERGRWNGGEAPGDGVHSQGLMVGLLGRHKRSVGSQWIMNPRIGNLKTKYGS